MQLPVFGDMDFRSNGMSEDCLYLNVWAPAEPIAEQLRVLVYFYGGGNVAGDGSEPRYDGTRLAQRGIITLSVNYRLNIFGFFAHPELTQESPQHASGNYGYLDQAAALRWVRENIAAIGLGCMGMSFGYGPVADKQAMIALISISRRARRHLLRYG